MYSSFRNSLLSSFNPGGAIPSSPPNHPTTISKHPDAYQPQLIHTILDWQEFKKTFIETQIGRRILNLPAVDFNLPDFSSATNEAELLYEVIGPLTTIVNRSLDKVYLAPVVDLLPRCIQTKDFKVAHGVLGFLPQNDLVWDELFMEANQDSRLPWHEFNVTEKEMWSIQHREMLINGLDEEEAQQWQFACREMDLKEPNELARPFDEAQWLAAIYLGRCWTYTLRRIVQKIMWSDRQFLMDKIALGNLFEFLLDDLRSSKALEEPFQTSIQEMMGYLSVYLLVSQDDNEYATLRKELLEAFQADSLCNFIITKYPNSFIVQEAGLVENGRRSNFRALIDIILVLPPPISILLPPGSLISANSNKLTLSGGDILAAGPQTSIPAFASTLQLASSASLIIPQEAKVLLQGNRLPGELKHSWNLDLVKFDRQHPTEDVLWAISQAYSYAHQHNARYFYILTNQAIIACQRAQTASGEARNGYIHISNPILLKSPCRRDDSPSMMLGLFFLHLLAGNCEDGFLSSNMWDGQTRRFDWHNRSSYIDI